MWMFRRQATDPMLVNDPVYLRPPKFSDHDQWCAVRKESRSHLERWEDKWPAEAFNPNVFRARVKLAGRIIASRRGAPFLVFARENDQLVGGVTLHSVRYGAIQSGILGYWVGSEWLNKGFGSAAVRAVTHYSFQQLGLNRIEAACQPENKASAALLKKCGFGREGTARSYLRINDEWRDHDIYSLIASEWNG